MKIVLASPLYPPDIGQPAPYIKELAKRLATQNVVTVVTYGRLPEAVPGVQIIAINKLQPLPIRLICYTWSLLQASMGADIIYAQNGPSVELPAALVATITRMPLLLHFGDAPAHIHASQNAMHGWVEATATKVACSVVTDAVPERPEILPLETYPTEALRAYEHWWTTHVTHLEKLFITYARKR